MKKISDIDIGRLANMRERRIGDRRDIPIGSDGLPADRSLCGWCYGENANCTVCLGTGTVCPACRGGRVMSIVAAERPQYRACGSCTNWDDSRRHEWGASGNAYNWPVFTRNIDREMAAVDYYRRSKRDADVLAARDSVNERQVS